MVNKLLSQLANVEILTPKIDDTLWFFKDILGLYEVGRKGKSVYLRGWEDWYTYSLKVTESDTAGVKEIVWRTYSEKDLIDAINIVNSNGLGLGWDEGEPDMGIGRGYKFILPSGQIGKLVWEMKTWRASGELRSGYKARPMKKPTKGVQAKDLSHIFIFAYNDGALAKTVELLKKLTFKVNEILKEGDKKIAYWMAVNGTAHDLAIGLDPSGVPARLNHVTFNVDYADDILRAADFYTDYGLEIVGGPLRHGITDSNSLYVKEPGGNLIELLHGGYLNVVPDWEPVVWDTNEDGDRWLYYWGHVKEAFWHGSPIPATRISDELKEIVRQKLGAKI
ncbi:VOC family protein [Saccharolobus islandicus]|uniref:Catechol 2,3 dioxygenase n=1 Tax=Saccharolobus islandicus (strain REY15A) TaxID=930945 RepID=F0NG99_SACI5|nr:VOC family protein [Sulfolobus islandicus]ADX84471.1 catechol 2,3 dioxygenase [Sulfolobus islandicus REY15A]